MNNLKKLRVEAGLSYRQLADKVGISNTQLLMLENETRRFNNDNIEKLCNFFKCDASYLLGMEVEKVEVFEQEDIDFLHAYKNLDLAEKEILSVFLEFLNYKRNYKK